MMLETEIKLSITDLADALLRVQSIGARVFKERYFEDNFVFDNGTQTLQKNKMLLRVRMVGARHASPLDQSCILTFKGTPDYSRGVKDREEIECEVSDPDRLIQILSRLGFSIFFRYQKYRTIYTIDSVSLEICIDETPIGNYFELEGELKSIQEYANRLGYSPQQYITESYSSLYSRWRRENQRESVHMMFE